jgi:RHS repeat-associated protein
MRAIRPTDYLYDGFSDIEELDNSGNVLARYTETQYIDEPLAEVRSGTTSYYEQDDVGSVSALSNSTGALAASYSYDTFGNLTASNGSITNPFRYTGREFDQETGIYEYRARYYDPVAGRFISEDPIRFWGGSHFYRYVHNSPANLTDPFGLRDYNEQETLDLFPNPAYNDATSGYFSGLWNIHNHSTGGGDFDFGHNEHAGDTFTRCGMKMSAGDFGNYIAGFEGGAWDDAHYGDREIGFSSNHTYQLRYAETMARLAGLYYHVKGDTDVKNDPWDKTGWPWITNGADDGRSFSKKGGGCGCH